MFREALILLVVPSVLSHTMSAQSSSQSTSSVSQSRNVETKESSSWETAAKERRDELIRINGSGTDTVLRDHLLKMSEEDQAVRGFANGKQTSVMTKEMMQKLPATDTRLTLELQQIVKEKGWPTITLVGINASNAAMLMLTHTADHTWQREMLPQLQTLADTDKIDASSLALVIDKELVAEGKLQRYGSQFKIH